MKQWKLITIILTLLMLISAAACKPSYREVIELKDEVDRLEQELNACRSDFHALRYDYNALIDISQATRNDLAETTAELKEARFQLAQLTETKEMDFGWGLRIFDIETRTYGIGGKIQNISSVPMPMVKIIIAVYQDDGSLKDLVMDTAYDMNPGDVAEWNSWGRYGENYGVYALGNK